MVELDHKRSAAKILVNKMGLDTFVLWLKSWMMMIVESKDVLRIKRFLLKNCLQPKQY